MGFYSAKYLQKPVTMAVKTCRGVKSTIFEVAASRNSEVKYRSEKLVFMYTSRIILTIVHPLTV